MLGDDRGDDRAEAVERVGAAEIVLVEDCRREAGFAKIITPRAVWRKPWHEPVPTHEKEAVLHLVMQPADRGERAKIVSLDNRGVRFQPSLLQLALSPMMPRGEDATGDGGHRSEGEPGLGVLGRDPRPAEVAAEDDRRAFPRFGLQGEDVAATAHDREPAAALGVGAGKVRFER